MTALCSLAALLPSHAAESAFLAEGSGSTPPRLVWLTGFEHAVVSSAGGGIFSNVQGTPTTDGTVRRSGNYSLRIAPAGAGVTATRMLSGAPTVAVIRFALRLDSLPSKSVNLFSVGTSAGSAAFLRYVKPATLGVRFRNGPTVDASNTVVAGRWYVLEVMANYGTNPRTIDWRVDGVDQPRLQQSEPQAAVAKVEWGDGGAVAYTAHVDDVAVSVTAADYPLGDGQVLALRPSASGGHSRAQDFRATSNNWTTSSPLVTGETSSWQYLDEWPIDAGVTSDAVAQSVLGNTSYVEYVLEDPTETTTANGISPILAVRTATTAPSQQTARITDDGAATSDIFTQLNVAATAPQYKSATFASRPSDGGRWTADALASLRVRWGYAGDVDPQPRLDAILVEADYPLLPSNLTLPSIAGTPEAGQTLTADRGTWSGTEPISYAYQWRRCDSDGTACSDIAAASAQSYTATAADVGSTLRIAVTATNGAGTSTAVSAATAVIAAAPVAPTNTSPPTIAGTPEAGQTLTADRGTWSGTEPISYAYQWRRCDSDGTACSDIAAASAQSYTATAADVGSTLRIAVTATNGAGTSTAASAATAPVVPASSGDTTPPTIGTLAPASDVTSDSFALSWSAASDANGIASYRLDVATDAAFTAFVPGYEDRDVGTALAATVGGLAPGTSYWARLRALDPAGNVSADSNTVTAATAWVYDRFERTVANGWGATGGFSWAIDTSKASEYAVDGSVGAITQASTGARYAHVALGRRDVSVLVKLRLTRLPSTSWNGFYALARVGGPSSWYAVRVRSVAGGADDIEFNKNSAATGLVRVGSTAVVPELVAARWYWLRLETDGDGASTTLRARLWADGSSEPGGWTLSATDATAELQGPAGVGVRLASNTTSQPAALEVDTFSATATSGSP